jgi:hypothetical protein
VNWQHQLIISNCPIFFFWQILLCSLDWPSTHHPPASASQGLRLQPPHLILVLNYHTNQQKGGISLTIWNKFSPNKFMGKPVPSLWLLEAQCHHPLELTEERPSGEVTLKSLTLDPIPHRGRAGEQLSTWATWNLPPTSWWPWASHMTLQQDTGESISPGGAEWIMHGGRRRLGLAAAHLWAHTPFRAIRWGNRTSLEIMLQPLLIFD